MNAMTGKPSGSGVAYGAAGVLLIAILGAYPLAFGRWILGALPFWSEAPLFGHLELAFFAAAVCLLHSDRLRRFFLADKLSRAFAVAAGIAVCFALARWMIFDTSTMRLGAGCFYLFLPLAGVAAAPELRRLLPVALTVLALLTLLTLLRESSDDLMAVGLVGNWNWNNTLLAVSAAGAALLLFRHRRPAVAAAVAAAGVVLAWRFLLPGQASLATLLAVAGALIFLPLWLHCPAKYRLAAGVMGGIAAAVLFLFLILNIGDNSRVELWRATLELIRQRPVAGVGPGDFEFAIVEPLAETGYYLTPFAADRQPHPHNELLFYWAQFGIAGFAAALLLLGAALRGLGRLKRSDATGIVLGGIFLVLLFHGQFDVLLSEPLTGGIFLLLAGIFWQQGVLSCDPLPVAVGGRRIAVAGLLALLALGLGIDQFYGGLALRAARAARADGNLEEAEARLAEALPHRLTAEKIYFASGLVLFDRKEPKRALELLHLLRSDLRQPFYSHSLNREARAHAVLGNADAARECFRLEQRHYPLSIVNAVLYGQFLTRMGTPQELEGARTQLEQLMERKKVLPDELPQLLREPVLDDTPVMLRAYRERQRLK